MNLTPSEFDMHFNVPSRNVEVETWCEVFGIENHYKAKLCRQYEGKAWGQKIIEEFAKGDVTAEQLLIFGLQSSS